MRIRSIVAMLFVLSTCLHSNAAHSQSTSLEVVETDDAAPADQLVVSRDRANRIVVQVMVNDLGPFDFLLDTGANQSAVSAAFAAKLQLETTSPAQLHGVTGEAKVARVKVAKLEAGSLLLKNQKMAVIDATMNGLDGVLGVDGFRNKRVAAHIVNNVVTIERSKKTNERSSFAGYATFPLEFKHGLLALIPASIAGAEVKAVIDTGSEGSLGTESLRQTLGLRPKPADASILKRVQGVTGDVQHGESLTTPLIRLDCVAASTYSFILIRDIPIAYGDFYVFDLWGMRSESALLVGMDILGRMQEVVIDYGNKKMHWKQGT